MYVEKIEMYVHSSKKFLEVVKEVPAGASYWKTVTSYIPEGIICKEVRKSKRGGVKTLYHVHKVGGSNAPFGKYGCHDIYIIRGEA